MSNCFDIKEVNTYSDKMSNAPGMSGLKGSQTPGRGAVRHPSDKGPPSEGCRCQAFPERGSK